MGIYHANMSVLPAKRLNEYRRRYPEADAALKAWKAQIEGQNYQHFIALKSTFGRADFIKPDRVIFNVEGNHFRLITAVDFNRQVVLVKWFGRHKDDDKINPSEV